MNRGDAGSSKGAIDALGCLPPRIKFSKSCLSAASPWSIKAAGAEVVLAGCPEAPQGWAQANLAGIKGGLGAPLVASSSELHPSKVLRHLVSESFVLPNTPKGHLLLAPHCFSVVQRMSGCRRKPGLGLIWIHTCLSLAGPSCAVSWQALFICQNCSFLLEIIKYSSDWREGRRSEWICSLSDQIIKL